MLKRGRSGVSSNEIYFLEPLCEIVETVLFSASIRDECPVSILIVGPSGSAKTKLIKSFQSDNIHQTDSVTSQGLWDIVQHDSKNDKKFIMIPDINPTLARKSATTQATIGNLLSVTADGTVRVDDGRGEKICTHAPIGMISACTPEIYHKHSKQWYALGLVRRIIPIFFTYSMPTIDKLQKLVREDKIHGAFSVPKVFTFPPASSPALNGVASYPLQEKSSLLATNLGKLSFNDDGIKRWHIKNILPVSPHVVIRTLVKAHALRRKSGKIEEQDLDFITSFVSFTDPENPRQL